MMSTTLGLDKVNVPGGRFWEPQPDSEEEMIAVELYRQSLIERGIIEPIDEPLPFI